MKKITLVLVVIPFFLSCSSIKESVVDVASGQKIAGYDKDCKFRIGKTTKEEISPTDLASFEKDSVKFLFTEGTHGKMLGVGFSGNFSTSKGLKSGDPVEKALRIYGKPIAAELDYGKDEVNRIHWVFHGLFYKNFSVFTDSDLKTVIGISIGAGPNLSKRIVKKKKLPK